MAGRLLIAAVALLIVTRIPVSAQKREDKKSPFKQFATDVDKLVQVDIPGANADQESKFIDLWRELNRDLKSLGAVLDESQSELSAEYRESLKNNEEAFARVFDKKLSVEEKLEVCGSIAKDVEVKKGYAKKNAKDGFGKIKVSVTTKDGGKEVSDFEVWYVPAAWDTVKERYKRYDKNSSPTVQPLAPGAYKMWTQVPGRDAAGRKQPVSVGEEGKPDQQVDLPVPDKK